MPAILRVISATALTLAAIVATVLLVVWPWPAPVVDWRTPLYGALDRGDCDRAVAILTAATDAGSAEAYDFLLKPDRRSHCLSDPRLPEDAARDARALRIHRQIGVPPLFSDDDDTDTWLAYYVRAVDFLCRRPYQPGMNVDNVLLSATLKEDAGWFLALHRRRRDVCVGVVEHLALALAERSERSAKELAYVFAMDDPSSHTATSEVAVASLLLDQRFVPDVLARGDAEQLILARRMAWSKLRGHGRSCTRDTVDHRAVARSALSG